MLSRNGAVMLVLASALAAPIPAWAFGGGIGCTNLPEYDRAVGALQGMTSACDMSVEQARRIVAAQGGTAGSEPVAPAPHAHRLRHRARAPQP